MLGQKKKFVAMPWTWLNNAQNDNKLIKIKLKKLIIINDIDKKVRKDIKAESQESKKSISSSLFFFPSFWKALYKSQYIFLIFISCISLLFNSFIPPCTLLTLLFQTCKLRYAPLLALFIPLPLLTPFISTSASVFDFFS